MSYERQRPYGAALDLIAARRFPHVDLKPADGRQIAAALTAGYEKCLIGWNGWRELQQSHTVTVDSNKLVAWADIKGADFASFFTVNPIANPTTFNEIRQITNNASGIYLDTDLTTVWAIYQPRNPLFRHKPIQTGVNYAVDSIVWVPDATEPDDLSLSKMYRSLAADATSANLSNSAKWIEQTILKELLTASTLYAVAELLGNISDQRLQAAVVKAEAYDAFQVAVQRSQIPQ